MGLEQEGTGDRLSYRMSPADEGFLLPSTKATNQRSSYCGNRLYRKQSVRSGKFLSIFATDSSEEVPVGVPAPSLLLLEDMLGCHQGSPPYIQNQPVAFNRTTPGDGFIRSQADHDWSAYTAFLGKQRRLSSDSLSELMPYYVLPYIDAPHTHELTQQVVREGMQAT